MNKFVQLGLVDKMSEYIHGFSDSLTLMRKKFPKRTKGYKLTSLAAGLLSLSPENAHDAKYDVYLLESLVLEYLDITDFIHIILSIPEVVNELNRNNSKKKTFTIICTGEAGNWYFYFIISS